MKRLILGKLPNDFNKENDLLLSCASFLESEKELQNYKKYEFHEVYPKEIQSYDAANIASLLAHYHLKNLSNYLQNQYNIDLTIKEWKIILFPWLLQICHILTDRYFRVKSFIRIHHDDSVLVEGVCTNNKPQTYNLRDLSSLIQKHALNEWIYTMIIEQLLPNNWVINKAVNKDKIIEAKNLVKRGWLEGFKLKIKESFRVSNIYGASPFNLLILSLWTNLIPKKKIHKQRPLSSIALEEHSIPSFLKSDLVKDFILTLAPKEYEKIPEYYIKTKASPGRVRVIGNSIYSSLSLQVSTAKRIIAGEIILGNQHGGGYGRYKTINYLSEIEGNLSGFISWGWSKSSSFKGAIHPLPSPLLSKMHNKHKRRTKDIILVGTKCNPYSIRINYNYLPSEMLRYRDMKVNFINHLSCEAKKELSYRPYFESPDHFEDSKYLNSYFPKLKILHSNFQDKIMSCSILILDHLSTTLNIALAANIPLVCIEKKMSSWIENEESLESMRILKDAGIIFDCEIEAALFVNSNLHDIEKWWYSQNTQKARKKWLESYGLTSDKWMSDWIHFILNL